MAPRAGLDRDRIARAGADLSDRIGFDRLTLSALARDLGVRPPSLYAHLSDLAGLRREVARIALDELADELGEAIGGRSGRAAIAAVLSTHARYAAAHPGRTAAMTHRFEPDPATLAAGRRHSRLLAAVLRGYDLPESAQLPAIRFLGSQIHGSTVLQLSGNFDHSDPSPDLDVVATALDTLLRHWPTEEGSR